MKVGKFINGKIEYYIPSYNFMRIGSGGIKNDVVGTGRTESKIIYYDAQSDFILEEGTRYVFEIIDDENKIVKILRPKWSKKSDQKIFRVKWPKNIS